MSMSATRIGAVIRKDLAEFRRNRFIVTTAAILPIIFLISPTASILTIKASAATALLDRRVGDSLFFPLLTPVFVPATMSAFSGGPAADQPEVRRSGAARWGQRAAEPGLGAGLDGPAADAARRGRRPGDASGGHRAALPGCRGAFRLPRRGGRAGQQERRPAMSPGSLTTDFTVPLFGTLMCIKPAFTRPTVQFGVRIPGERAGTTVIRRETARLLLADRGHRRLLHRRGSDAPWTRVMVADQDHPAAGGGCRPGLFLDRAEEIGRASCRERV